MEQLHDKIDIFYYTNGKTWGELKSELTKINPRYVHNFDDRVFHLDNDIRKNNDKTKSQTELILCLNNYYNPNQYEFKILMFDDCGIQTNLSQEQRKNEAKKSPTFKNLFPNNAKFITYVVQYYRLTNAVESESNNEMLVEIKKFVPDLFSKIKGGKIKYKKKSKKRHYKKSKKKRHHKKSKKRRR